MSEDKRARDVDRQLGVDALQSALAQGQLRGNEYDDRVARVLVAVTMSDISRELADLQGVGERAQDSTVLPVVRGGGRASMTMPHDVGTSDVPQAPLALRIAFGAVFILVLVAFVSVFVTILSANRSMF